MRTNGCDVVLEKIQGIQYHDREMRLWISGSDLDRSGFFCVLEWVSRFLFDMKMNVMTF